MCVQSFRGSSSLGPAEFTYVLCNFFRIKLYYSSFSFLRNDQHTILIFFSFFLGLFFSFIEQVFKNKISSKNLEKKILENHFVIALMDFFSSLIEKIIDLEKKNHRAVNLKNHFVYRHLIKLQNFSHTEATCFLWSDTMVVKLKLESDKEITRNWFY